eukprot:2445201-Amphidinium_carterae.2
MALLMQCSQGDIRSHLLLTQNLATANFDDAATKVKDYCRNVYIDNINPGGIQAFKGGKPWKGKGKDKHKKGKGDYYNQQKGKGSDYQQSQQPYQTWRGIGKGGKYGQRPYRSILIKEQNKRKRLPKLVVYNNYSRPKGSYNNYRKGKGKGSKSQGPPLPPNACGKGKGSSKGKGGKRTDIVCYYLEDQDTLQTNTGGQDKSTTLINHNRCGQYRLTISLNNYNNYLNPQHLR